MQDEIRMIYPEMDEMKRIFADGGRALEDLNSQVKQWATMVNDGALLGDAGEALAEAFTTRLSPKIQLLTEKMTELEGDITKAVDDFQAAEKKAAGMFA
jgi:uncharacterized protein YukE